MELQKKRHPKFNVPNFGAKNRKRVKERWRKQRGVDNKKRVKKAFMGAEPTIGWGNPEALKHVRVDGKRSVIVHNVNELKTLLANPEIKNFDVMLAGALSVRKRIEMTRLANEKKVRVTNGEMK